MAAPFGKSAGISGMDRGGWFTIAQAQEKLLPGQRGFLDELQRKLVDS